MNLQLTAGEWLIAGLVLLFLAYEVCCRIAQACMYVEDALEGLGEAHRPDPPEVAFTHHEAAPRADQDADACTGR
jgi:hypothetical protein